ncbi:hypothetical protein MNB_SV-5-1571 [hydrothermal vent metagenome]|uniref:Lipoprotein n=1 Tax=hydrothermal vent metagenome TaxID=652676 RepID=A0A1W1EEZ3_9ZZZZ
MKKTKLISAAALTLLLMVGCATNEPKFNVNDTMTVMHDDKAYNIPKGSHLSPFTDSKVLEVYTKAGLKNCEKGALTWEENSVSEEIGIAIKQGDKDIFKKLAKENKIGCVKPSK